MDITIENTAMEEPTGLHPAPVLDISRYVTGRIESFTKIHEKKAQDEKAFFDKFNAVISKYFNALRASRTNQSESKYPAEYPNNSKEDEAKPGNYASDFKAVERMTNEIVEASIQQLKRESDFLAAFTEELSKLVINNAELSPEARESIRSELDGNPIAPFNIADLNAAKKFHSVLVTRYVKLLSVVETLYKKLDTANDKISAGKLRDELYKGVARMLGINEKGGSANLQDALAGQAGVGLSIGGAPLAGQVGAGLSVGGAPLAALGFAGLGTNGKKGRNSRNSLMGLFPEQGREGSSNFLAQAINVNRIGANDRLAVLHMPRVKSVTGVKFNYKQIYTFVNDVAGVYNLSPANLFRQFPGISIPSNEFLILLADVDVVRGIGAGSADWWKTKLAQYPLETGNEVGSGPMQGVPREDVAESTDNESRSGTPNGQAPEEAETRVVVYRARPEKRSLETATDGHDTNERKSAPRSEGTNGIHENDYTREQPEINEIKMRGTPQTSAKSQPDNQRRPGKKSTRKGYRIKPVDSGVDGSVRPGKLREVVVSSDDLSEKEATQKAMVDQLLDKLLVSMGKVVTAEEIDRLHREVFNKSVKIFKEMIEPLDKCTNGEEFDDLLRNYISPDLHTALQTRVRLIRSTTSMSTVTLHELMVSDGVRVEFANLIGMQLAYKESQRANSYLQAKARDALNQQLKEAIYVVDNLMHRSAPYVWFRGKKLNSM